MRTLFILSATILFIVFSFSCAQGASGPKFGTGTIKPPSLEIKVHGTDGNNPSVSLPLLIWSSFEYQMINNYGRIPGSNFTGGGKSEYCVLQESEGSQLQVETKVEVLDEARCLYVRLNSIEGSPKSYTTGIMRIRVVETGQEGWTWSKAIEFDKK